MQDRLTIMVSFRILHNISSSKGWGRYKATTNDGPLVTSSTGNEWVSASHSGLVTEQKVMEVKLQTMERVGKSRRESINTYEYRLVAMEGTVSVLGYSNGLEIEVVNAIPVD